MSAPGYFAAAHPFTPIAFSAATAGLALLLPGDGVLLLAVLTAIAVTAGGAARAIRHGVLLVLPLAFFLVLLHGVLGDASTAGVPILGTAIDPAGLRYAAVQGARLLTMILATLTAAYTTDPARLLDAVSGRPALWRVVSLLLVTRDTVRRFRDRAGEIVDAQRARGLRLRGSPWRKVRALRPLLFPLLLSALVDSETRAIGLESRGLLTMRQRTPLAPRLDRWHDRLVRYAALAAVLAALAWRIAR